MCILPSEEEALKEWRAEGHRDRALGLVDMVDQVETMKAVPSDEDMASLLQERIAPMKAWQQMNTLQHPSEKEGLVDVVEKAEAMEDLTSDQDLAALLQEQIVLQPFLQLLSESGFLWV